MRNSWFKYLMILFCFFTIAVKTGVSLNAVFHVIKSADTECAYNCNDDENTPERSETKESAAKEYWDTQHRVTIAAPFRIFKPIAFVSQPGSNHLAWVPPVPTPPPNV